MQPYVIGSCQNHKHEVLSVPEPSKWHIAASGIAMPWGSPGVAAAGERADDVALHFPWPLKFIHNKENLFLEQKSSMVSCFLQTSFTKQNTTNSASHYCAEKKKSLDQTKESPMKKVVQERGGGSPMSVLSMEEGAGVHDEPLLSGGKYLMWKNHLKVSEFQPMQSQDFPGPSFVTVAHLIHTEGAMSSDFSSSMVIVLRKRKVLKSNSGPAESEMTNRQYRQHSW